MDLIDDVLIYEWAIRIFINLHGFEDRQQALRHIQRQEQAAIFNAPA